MLKIEIGDVVNSIISPPPLSVYIGKDLTIDSYLLWVRK